MEGETTSETVMEAELTAEEVPVEVDEEVSTIQYGLVLIAVRWLG